MMKILSQLFYMFIAETSNGITVYLAEQPVKYVDNNI